MHGRENIFVGGGAYVCCCPNCSLYFNVFDDFTFSPVHGFVVMINFKNYIMLGFRQGFL